MAEIGNNFRGRSGDRVIDYNSRTPRNSFKLDNSQETDGKFSFGGNRSKY